MATFLKIFAVFKTEISNYYFFQISNWFVDETTFCLMNLIILFCTDQVLNLFIYIWKLHPASQPTIYICISKICFFAEKCTSFCYAFQRAMIVLIFKKPFETGPQPIHLTLVNAGSIMLLTWQIIKNLLNEMTILN